jgi:hypothetical protein
VDALPGERVEVRGHRGHQGLSFTGLHLGDPAPVEPHRARHLDVEVALADGPLGRLTHAGESFREDVVEGLALGKAPAELLGLAAKLLVGQLRKLVLERVDQRHVFLEALDLPALADPSDLSEHQGGTLRFSCGGNGSEP